MQNSTVILSVEEQLSQRQLVRDNEPLLVAVSGGLDSMVLLHILLQLAPKHGWKITVAHFNHQLRGHASDADEKFVRSTCLKCKVPFEVGLADVKAFAKRSKLSIEMAARKLRHEFLARTAKAEKIQTVALAHHADDQIELFFLRLLRGAGGEGLAGMKWNSPSPVDPKIKLVRPLLGQTKADLKSYAQKCKVFFREDASNASLDFQRNKIRHKLVPLLQKEFQPALMSTLLRTMDIVGEESAFIAKAAQQWLKSSATNFEKLPVAMQRRVLLEQILGSGLPPESQVIEQLRLDPDRSVNLSETLAVSRDRAGKLRLRTHEVVSFQSESVTVDTLVKCKVVFGSLTLSWKRIKRLGDAFLRKGRTEFFDAEKVGRKVTLRFWQPGDRYWPIGMKSPAKLQDLFMNSKVARSERHQKVVAATEEGRIFWVEGMRISEEFKLTSSSKLRLCWSWKN